MIKAEPEDNILRFREIIPFKTPKTRRMIRDEKRRLRCTSCANLEVITVHFSKIYVCKLYDSEVGQFHSCNLGTKRR